jgi:hypothetical protein
MRKYVAVSAVLLSVTLFAGISCSKPAESTPTPVSPAITAVSKPATTISITPKSGKAGTKFDISCNNLSGDSKVTVKVLPADGSPVIDRAATSTNSSTFTTAISTFGFNPGHYQCKLEDADGKQLALTEFDVTGTKNVVFEDDFSNGYSGWYVYSNDIDSFSYGSYNGEPVYHIKSKAESNWIDFTPLQNPGIIGNFVAEVDCRPDPASPNPLCGIIFRYVPENNENLWNTKSKFYAFGASNNPGKYGALKFLSGKFVTLINYTQTDATRKDQPNHIKVACNSSTIECYINGLQVETFEDNDLPDKGYLGLAAYGPRLDAYFDNFVVYQVK